MYAVLTKKKVFIYISDNFTVSVSKSNLKINDKVVLWESPITKLPVPVPISKKK